MFTKLGTTSGFWQVPLHKESMLLTTFIMSEGRYYFKRLPFGIASAREHFQKSISLLVRVRVTWAYERLSRYISALDFTIRTDRKPLITLLKSRALSDLPPRILKLRLQLLRFDFDIVQVPGKNLITAEALSTAPLPTKLTMKE